MADAFMSLLVGGTGGFVSAVITYFSTRAKTRLELAVEYDKKLQENRLEAYKKLWGMLESLARFGREKPVTYEELRKISNATREWYFHEGGIYLTRESRAPYFHMKELIQPVLDNKEFADKPTAPIPDQALEEIIRTGSSLRTSLSDDIGTKRASWL
jgi:hypothetical protein